MNEIVINEGLQKLSNAFLDTLNLIFTQAGSEMFFIIVGMVVFWCVDKRFGYKLITVFIYSSIVIAGMKTVVRRPRPFTHDTVRSIGEKTASWSFPSGHSHTAANLTTQICAKYRKHWLIAVGATLTAIVMFTRLYLGQHFLSDVLVGCALGVVLSLGFSFLFEKCGAMVDKMFIVVAPVCIIALAVMAIFGVDNATLYDACGGYAAVTVGYYLEKKYVGFVPSASAGQNAIKLLIGAAVVLAIKEGLKALLKLCAVTAPIVYNGLRYFLVGFVAIFVLPLIFKKLGLERKSEVKNSNNSGCRAENSENA